MIQKARRIQYQTFLDNNKNNPSSIYKIFREVGAGKGLRKQSTVGSVKVEDTFIEDSTGIANEFNDFFRKCCIKVKRTCN